MKNGLTSKGVAILCIICACCIICGCNPQLRLNRLYERNPQLFAIDTVVVDDTIVVAPKSIDTKAALPVGKDTVINFKNPQSTMRGELRMIYINDTVFVNVQARTTPDTITYTKTLITNNQPKTIHQVDKPSWWKLWVGIALGLFGFITLKYLEFIIFKK